MPPGLRPLPESDVPPLSAAPPALPPRAYRLRVNLLRTRLSAGLHLGFIHLRFAGIESGDIGTQQLTGPAQKWFTALARLRI